MAQIIFDIPDPQLNRVINALSDYYGWTSGSGQTRAQFAKAKMIELMVGVLKDAELNAARNTATQTTLAGFVDPNIT